MFEKRKIDKFLQVLVIFFTLFLFNQQNLLAQELIKVDILSINDFHGSLLQDGKTPGGGKLAGFINVLREQNPDGTIIVSAGDMFQGSVRSNILYGKPVIQIMNKMNINAMALGNHEFDWGMDKLYKNVKMANFPVLAANILDKKTNKIVDFALPYTIVMVKGIKVGIIGLATPQTAYTTSIKVASQFIFLDPAQTVKNAYKELKEQEAEIIIVLGHIDYYLDNGVEKGEAINLIDTLYNTDYKIDAVISGHSHKIAKLKRHNIPLVQAASNGRYVGKITLYFSKEDKKVVDSSVTVLPVPLDQVPDKKIEKIIDSSAKLAKPIEDKIIGQTTGLEHNRYNLSQLGMWICDSLRKKSDSQIAFYNAGGLRKPLAKGKITLGDTYEIIPFDNTIVKMDLTGKQILEALEFGFSNQSGILQYSGLNVVYDQTNKKVISVTLTNGEPLVLNKLYTICTNDFLSDGGDGFVVFTQGQNIFNTNIVVRDAFVEAIKKEDVVTFKYDDRLQIKALANAA